MPQVPLLPVQTSLGEGVVREVRNAGQVVADVARRAVRRFRIGPHHRGVTVVDL